MTPLDEDDARQQFGGQPRLALLNRSRHHRLSLHPARADAAPGRRAGRSGRFPPHADCSARGVSRLRLPEGERYIIPAAPGGDSARFPGSPPGSIRSARSPDANADENSRWLSSRSGHSPRGRRRAAAFGFAPPGPVPTAYHQARGRAESTDEGEKTRGPVGWTARPTWPGCRSRSRHGQPGLRMRAGRRAEDGPGGRPGRDDREQPGVQPWRDAAEIYLLWRGDEPGHSLVGSPAGHKIARSCDG